MSSPSTISVLITHVPLKERVECLAIKAFGEWTGKPENVLDSHSGGRYWYTDQCIESFFEHILHDHAYIEGSQGDVISWAYVGNYVNIDDFITQTAPFIKSLIAEFTYASATFMIAPENGLVAFYKLDGTHANYWRCEPPVTFDVCLANLPRRI